MKLWKRVLVGSGVFACALHVALFTASCEDAEPSADGVVYLGGATDEALDALIAATPKSDPSKAVAFEEPLKDEAIPGDTPFTFTWTEASASASLDRRWRSPGDFSPRDVAAPPALDRALGVLLSGTPVAHAHGDPISGPAYYVVFSSSTDPEIVRVFTTNTDYTPEESQWGKLRGATGAITARITWADFESNRVIEGGGPFEGTPVTFTIK